MVAHEDVLAVQASVVAPPAFRLLNGLAFRMVVGCERDAAPFKVAQHLLLPFRYDFVVVHGSYLIRKNANRYLSP